MEPRCLSETMRYSKP